MIKFNIFFQIKILQGNMRKITCQVLFKLYFNVTVDIFQKKNSFDEFKNSKYF